LLDVLFEKIGVHGKNVLQKYTIRVIIVKE